ncbi:MAG: hypothetical protein ACREDR_07160 [Blastocatellia bacterium]
MPKTKNTVGSLFIRVTLSVESVRLLDELAVVGVYGRNKAEVAGRFIDDALKGFVEKPQLKLKGQRREPSKAKSRAAKRAK